MLISQIFGNNLRMRESEKGKREKDVDNNNKNNNEQTLHEMFVYSLELDLSKRFILNTHK